MRVREVFPVAGPPDGKLSGSCCSAPAPMAFLLFRANPPGVLSILDLIIEPMADANLHTLPGF